MSVFLNVLMTLIPFCSSAPNCVSSEAKEPSHHIAPLTYRGDGEQAFSSLKEIVAKQPRTSLVEEKPGFAHFESKTKWLGFTDDLYFELDAKEDRIQMGSFSRVGYYDFGVNRSRLEEIRAKFQEKDQTAP